VIADELVARAGKVARVDSERRAEFETDFRSIVPAALTSSVALGRDQSPAMVRSRLERMARALATLEEELEHGGELWGYFVSHPSPEVSARDWSRFWRGRTAYFARQVAAWRGAVSRLSLLPVRGGRPPALDGKVMAAQAARHLLARHTDTKPTRTPGGPFVGLAEIVLEAMTGETVTDGALEHACRIVLGGVAKTSV
jgi:hypothetical protein